MQQTPPNAAPTPEGQPPVLLTIEEARAVLRISRWSVYQLINRRRLKAVRIGQRRLVPAEDLHALVQELRQDGAAYDL